MLRKYAQNGLDRFFNKSSKDEEQEDRIEKSSGEIG